MMYTLSDKENFPTSAKTQSIAEAVTVKIVDELSKKHCGEALFCEQGYACDGIRCPALHSER